mgnify:CR=1 FL=1
MLKATIDPYTNLYKKLKDCFTDQETISISQKMVSYDALSIAEKLYYDLTTFYVVEFQKNSEARDVFKILLTSSSSSFTEEEKTLLLEKLYVKVRPLDYYKKKYWR